MLLIQLIIFIITIALLATLVITSLGFAPWVPTFKRDLGRILRLAGLKDGETFYDLGCGNGRVVCYVAKNPAINCIGIELALPLWLVCRIRQIFHKSSNLKIKFQNLYKEDLSSADAVFIYGMPHSVEGLKEKFQKEMKPGARVISYVFPLPDWQPELIDGGEKKAKIYLYKMGLSPNTLLKQGL